MPPSKGWMSIPPFQIGRARMTVSGSDALKAMPAQPSRKDKADYSGAAGLARGGLRKCDFPDGRWAARGLAS
jgi:hypothetical protein